MPNRNRLFWGVALITLGGLFLANRAGLPTFDHAFVSRFWPVLFILGGLNLILRQRENPAVWITTVLLGVAAPVAVFSLVTDGRDNDHYSINFSDDDEDDDNENTDSDTETPADSEADTDADYQRDRSSRDSTRQTNQLITNTFIESMSADTRAATLMLEGGAARFRIGDPTPDLIRADTRTTLVNYLMSVDRDGATRSPTIRLKPTGKNNKLRGADIDDRLTLHLNAAPAWTITVDMGAGTGDFDLSAYTVSALTVNAGLADIDLKLGDKAPKSSVNIDAGITSVVVRVPKSVGCRIVSDGALTSQQLDDFVSDERGAWVSPGYGDSAKKIDINYDGGLSRFKVVRY